MVEEFSLEPTDAAKKRAVLACSPLRYMGGKRWLAPHIKRLLPPHADYFEPFCGGAAVAINIAGRVSGRIHINDTRYDLMLFWRGITELPYGMLENKVRELSSLDEAEGRAGFDALKKSVFEDYDAALADPTNTQALLDATTHFLFLSKHAYMGRLVLRDRNYACGYNNGLMSMYKEMLGKPYDFASDCLPKVLHAQRALQGCALTQQHYGELDPTAEAFVYCDPPYHQAKRESYNAGDWQEGEHAELARVVREWVLRGCRVAVSYMATELIDELYEDWRCFEFRVKHTAGTRKVSNRDPAPVIMRDGRVARKKEVKSEPVVREMLYLSWL